MVLGTIANWDAVFADLPPEGLIVAGLIGLGGVVLWGFGRKVLRSGFLLIGALMGFGAGYVTSSFLSLPVPGLVVAAGGAVVLGLFGWLSYRPAMGMALATLLGFACPAGVIGWAEYRGMNLLGPQVQYDEDTNRIGSSSTDPAGEVLDELKESLDLLREAEDAVGDLRRWGEDRITRTRAGGQSLLEDEGESRASPDESTAADGQYIPPLWVVKLDQAIEVFKHEVSIRWEAAPGGVRKSILLSAGCGAILGFLVGLSLPAVAASVVTSMWGSLLMLGAGGVFITRFGADSLPWMPHNSTHWLIIWFILSLGGVAIQWIIRRKQADEPS